jgi:chemotaxis protein methyltransferase CheR
MAALEFEEGIPGAPTLEVRDFNALRASVKEVTGIVLADSKRTMLASRLLPRLRALNLPSFAAYRTYLESPQAFASERQSFINAVTTNKTSFFREGHQFDVLATQVVPLLVERATRTGRREVRVWSAACSTGEEPWTVAMVLRERLPSPASWNVHILATDIDTAVLATASRGVYDAQHIDGLSRERLAKHFVPSRDGAGTVHIHDELKRWVTFRQLNFMDVAWPIQSKFDLILCRNASIYFDAATQCRLFTRLAALLEPTGFLFVGHAEVIHWPEVPVQAQAGGVYRRRAGANSSAPTTEMESASLGKPVLKPPKSRPAPAIRLSPRSPESGLSQVVINVGEMHASSEPVEIKTLLGSCVAACLYDPKSGVGGMNHFLLPDSTHEVHDPARFGVHAMEMLINELMKLGAERRRLKAKLFGGGNILARHQRPTVGERNAEFARSFLRREGIPLVSERLVPECGTEVRFWPHAGRVFVRDVPTALLDMTRERTATPSMLKAGDVELF